MSVYIMFTPGLVVDVVNNDTGECIFTAASPARRVMLPRETVHRVAPAALILDAAARWASRNHLHVERVDIYKGDGR